MPRTEIPGTETETLQCKKNHYTKIYHNNSQVTRMFLQSFKIVDLNEIYKIDFKVRGALATLLPLVLQVMPKCSEWPNLPF